MSSVLSTEGRATVIRQAGDQFGDNRLMMQVAPIDCDVLNSLS